MVRSRSAPPSSGRSIKRFRSVVDEDHLITPIRCVGAAPRWPRRSSPTAGPRFGGPREDPVHSRHTDEHRTAYLQGNPALEGRVLFVSTQPGEPSAGFIKMNEALGEDEARIRQRVREGYWSAHVRTSDGRGEEWKHPATRRRPPFGRAVCEYRFPEPSRLAPATSRGCRARSNGLLAAIRSTRLRAAATNGSSPARRRPPGHTRRGTSWSSLIAVSLQDCPRIR